MRPDKVSIAQESETREILTPSQRFSYDPDLVAVSITTVIGIFIIFVGSAGAIELEGSIGSKLIGIVVSVFFSIIFTGWPLFLSLWYREVSQKVILFPKGIKYSNFLDKIECFWTDILIIEVVIHYETSERNELSSSWPEYEFITLNGIFSLKGKDLWDPIILKRIYEVIVSHNTNIIILEKEKKEIPSIGC